MSNIDNTVKYLEEKVSGFDIKNKEDSRFQRFLGKIVFYVKYMSIWTTLYPKVWKPKDAALRLDVLQHEGVHLLDGQTLFGLLPAKPVLKWLNVVLFSISYGFPQIFAVLAVFAILNLWWLLALLLLLPLPAPFRMIAEIRAYRRSRELGRAVEPMVKNFADSSYWFMWPFKKHVRKLMMKDSPYKGEMDKILK